MRTKTKKKLKAFAKNLGILLLEKIKELKELDVLIPDPFESKYEHMKRMRRSMQGYDTATISQGLYRLRQRGLIQPQKKKKTFAYELTLNGYQKLLIHKITQSIKPRNSNRACIIIFDIPEEKRKHRKFLRRLLIKNGFINLQKSVMIAPHNLTHEFIDLLNKLKLGQHVTIINGTVQYQ